MDRDGLRRLPRGGDRDREEYELYDRSDLESPAPERKGEKRAMSVRCIFKIRTPCARKAGYKKGGVLPDMCKLKSSLRQKGREKGVGVPDICKAAPFKDDHKRCQIFPLCTMFLLHLFHPIDIPALHNVLTAFVPSNLNAIH